MLKHGMRQDKTCYSGDYRKSLRSHIPLDNLYLRNKIPANFAPCESFVNTDRKDNFFDNSHISRDVRCTSVPRLGSSTRKPVRWTVEPPFLSPQRTRRRLRPSCCLTESSRKLGSSETCKRLSMVPQSFFSGKVVDKNDLVRLVPISTRLKSETNRNTRRRTVTPNYSHLRPFSSLGLASYLHKNSQIRLPYGSSLKAHSGCTRPASVCSQLRRYNLSHERPNVRFSDYFKVPFSSAPAKWNSINLFLEQWKSLYDSQGDHHDQPVHHRTYSQMTMSYPLPMDQRVIPGPLENRGGISESMDTGPFCQFKDGRNGLLESITIPHDSTKLDKTTSAMAELRDSAVSPVISLVNSNASVAMMEPQKTITPSVVRVQSNFCLAVEDISESAKRYAASLTGSRIRDRIVLWQLSTPRVLRSIQAILPKTIDNQSQDRCVEDTLAQNPFLQNAAVQELID
ncbi:hypothetical protein FGIG_08122 [Fasciola gigantica]|uniref:Uncharacterized protein n=1 Tax=Fasciola gigantica TaxID=46835 RepID=A0A504YLW2_FASGI|nr:hypothetical protein FGIG_08122 [Fasciola gigantica]